MPRLTRNKQQNQVLDQQLLEIVDEQIAHQGCIKSWNLISSRLFLRYHVKLNNKQCAQRYKNYSSKKNQPIINLTSQQQEEIFRRHTQGEKVQTIKKEMNLQSTAEADLKNIIKMIKQKIGRTLKRLLIDNFSRINFDSLKYAPKDQYRVLLIIISTAPLLKFYTQNGTNILEFRSKILQFDKLTLKTSRKKCGLKEMPKNQEIETLKSDILEELERIFDIYERVYFNPSLSKTLIGEREMKIHKQKFIYAKSAILNIPTEIIQDQLQLFAENQERQNVRFVEGEQDKNSEEQSLLLFRNPRFFQNQIMFECNFSEDLPSHSPIMEKNEHSLTIQGDSSPKFLFIEEESKNGLQSYLI